MLRNLKLTIALLALSAYAYGSCTIVQHTNKLACGSSNTTCTINASQGLVATGAGHIIFAAMSTTASGQTITAVSGGGTYAHCDGTHTNCAGSEATGGESTDVWTTLNSTSGATSITITRNAAGAASWATEVAEVSCSGTLAADNSGNNSNSTLSGTQTGVALSLTGTNDFIFQMIGTSAQTPNSPTQGYTLLDNGSTTGAAGLNNTVNGTAPVWSNSGTVRSASSAVAINDGQPPAVGGHDSMLPMMGVGY